MSSPPDPDERPSKRRARSAIACQRCRTRRQRCDNEFPSCSNCLSSRATCLYGDKHVYPADYVRSLEIHIATLEQKLTSYEARKSAEHMTEPSGISSLAASPDINRQCIHDDRTAGNGRADIGSGGNLELGVGFVALSSDAYLGTSSGFPLAKLVQSALNASILRPNSTRDLRSAHEPGERRRSGTPEREGRWTSALKAPMPDDSRSEELIQAYLLKVHPKHPFLLPKRILALNQRRASLRPTAQSSSNSQAEGRLDYVILHMIYGIGARYLQLADDYEYLSPDQHYAAAIEDVDVIFDVRSLESLEAMLLLSIYQLRSPGGLGVWGMIGTTMRQCLNCGLHRKSNVSPSLDQRRKRIFWTAYMLERSVARTIGRPCSVTDREIDLSLPANIDDDIESDEDTAAAIESSNSNSAQITSLSPAIHIIRMQQLESKIHHTVYRVDRPLSAIPQRKIIHLRNALEDWRSQIPTVVPPSQDSRSPYSTRDYHMIQYYKAILFLLLPFLPTLTPADPDFTTCAYAAGQICQTYKRLHNNQHYISFSLLALHANFVAGLTLVYCFCLDRSLFGVQFSSDVRACSTVLYIISERWPAARKVRDLFEGLVSATIEAGAAGQSQAHSSNRTRTRGQVDLATSSEAVTDATHSFQASNYANQGGTEASMPGTGPENVWDVFGTVLEDHQISSERWMQDGLFLSMDSFPEYGWTI